MFSRYVVSQVKHNSYFLVGLALGLWVALVAVPLDEDAAPCVTTSTPLLDEFEPHREERPPSNAASPASRVVQRPRYYSTELGMRGALLAAVLTSERALEGAARAINDTAAELQPALKFFITASALQPAPGRANVVGFTDTREMLKPFHTLKYLADNYLEEYNFFFLVSDGAFLNAHRLKQLVSRLSVSQDVYMGTPADGDTHYCSLEAGILLSNSVLRSVHGALDWCVRNSYSPHHHENLGRCVLHAAHVPCTTALQGEVYKSVQLQVSSNASAGLSPALGDAVTARGVRGAVRHRELHAYVSRVYLQRARDEVTSLRRYMTHAARRHPPGFRNASWPPGLRHDPGMQPPSPATRFDHLRWTLFNATHALLATDHRAAVPHTAPHRDALELVLSAARAWATAHRAPGTDTPRYELVEGAWCWQPATALRYKLLLRDGAGRMRQLEVARPLGAARLVPVPYVTESARVVCVLAVTPDRARHAAAWLRRYRAVALERDRNTDLIVVLVHEGSSSSESRALDAVREGVSALAAEHRDATLRVLDAAPSSSGAGDEDPLSVALRTAAPHAGRDALLLTVVDDMEFNEDFLNRVRMNTIAGGAWYSPVPFARYAQYAHPLFVDAAGNKPQQNTGRFDERDVRVLAVYRRDLERALEQQGGAAGGGGGGGGVGGALGRAGGAALRCVRAPEPGLVLLPPARPAPRTPPAHLNLGARHSLARLLLETLDRASAAL